MEAKKPRLREVIQPLAKARVSIVRGPEEQIQRMRRPVVATLPL